MLSSAHVAAVPLSMRYGDQLRPPEPLPTGLAACGTVEDEDHIVVLGGQGPELMCALLRAGASNVTHLRRNERPEPDSASLVIVPRITSLDWLATALPTIRRALTRGGRVILLTGRPTRTLNQVHRMLRLNGLAAIRTMTSGDGQMIAAEHT